MVVGDGDKKDLSLFPDAGGRGLTTSNGGMALGTSRVSGLSSGEHRQTEKDTDTQTDSERDKHADRKIGRDGHEN